MKTLLEIVAVGVVLWVAGSSTSATGAETDRPNIILVMADDLGWSDIGCYGGEIATPHLDSLAKGGLRFSQFYNNAICGPTRASLLTGLYCQQAGHRGDRWNEPKDWQKCVTIGEVLQQAGYQTAMVGKWQGRDSALDRGFSRFFGPMCQAKISYFHEVAGNPYFLDRERFALPEGFYLTEALNDYALQFLREGLKNPEPLFLYVAHIAPHWPLHAREEGIARHRRMYQESGWDDLRVSRLTRQRQAGLIPADWKLSSRAAGVPDWRSAMHKDWQAERMAVYAAQVAEIDRGVGQLLQALREAGQEENTLVMFLSDNGAAPDGGLAPTNSGFGFGSGAKTGAWRKDGVPIRAGSGPGKLPGPHDTFAAYGLAWANASNTPFRGTKLGAYEGGIRTPLVARWPAVIRDHGSITRQVGHVIDFMATCVDVAACEYPREFKGRQPRPLEGRSLLPIFTGRYREEHEELCWSVPQHHAIRTGPWKAVKRRGGGEWQLFNLAVDGTETQDLADREHLRLAQMTARFVEWQVRVGD
jgi:arylsulfatase A-like enzyme